MRRTHSEETKAQARGLCETTGMTYAEIGAALGGISGQTVSDWKQRGGWTPSPLAVRRKPIPKEKRSAAALLRQAGVPHDKIAVLLDCHPETARRIGREAGAGAAQPPPLADIAPREMAALEKALAAGEIPHADLLHLAELRFALAATQAIGKGDLDAHRNAQAAARTYATMKALPPGEAGPAAGVSLHDHQSGPAAFDENAFLEELTRQIEAFGAGGEGEGVRGGLAAGDAPAAQ